MTATRRPTTALRLRSSARCSRRWQRSRPAAPIEHFTFIDIGAGMGRAVLLAAQLPFHQVIGVELNPTLVRIARRNLAVWRSAGRARAPMKMICGDAVSIPAAGGSLPGIPLQSLWRDCDAAAAESLERSLRDHTQPLDLIYVNNEQEHVLEIELMRRPGAARLFLGQIRALACGCHCGSQDSGQPAGGRVCLVECRGLLDLALERIKQGTGNREQEKTRKIDRTVDEGAAKWECL